MADIAIPTHALGDGGWVQGRPQQVFSSLSQFGQIGGIKKDFRHFRDTTGTITDQVVLKSGATETPFVNGRVWLLRLADGYKAWEGWSDAGGWYIATGLEIGVEYVAVANDPLRNHKTTGAGPVTAT